MQKTYWYHSPRGFANEYSIAVATTAAHTAEYGSDDWERITRKEALHLLTKRAEAAGIISVLVEIDQYKDGHYDRFDVARALRGGLAEAEYVVRTRTPRAPGFYRQTVEDALFGLV